MVDTEMPLISEIILKQQVALWTVIF